MRGAALLLALSLASPAGAQAYQCAIDGPLALPAVKPDGPARRLPVTGYTLALSWSPEFCRTRERQPRHARQCAGRSGRFALVVHGLWPESGTSWPQWCPVSKPADVAAAAKPNLCLSPSATLLANQWAKHGACMVRRPATYFKVTRILWNGLRLPDYDRVSREPGLTAGTIRTRFADANPAWPREAIGIHLNRRGWLEEIQLCYDRRFRPRACDKARFGARDTAAAKIWRGL